MSQRRVYRLLMWYAHVLRTSEENYAGQLPAHIRAWLADHPNAGSRMSPRGQSPYSTDDSEAGRPWLPEDEAPEGPVSARTQRKGKGKAKRRHLQKDKAKRRGPSGEPGVDPDSLNSLTDRWTPLRGRWGAVSGLLGRSRAYSTAM